MPDSAKMIRVGHVTWPHSCQKERWVEERRLFVLFAERGVGGRRGRLALLALGKNLWK